VRAFNCFVPSAIKTVGPNVARDQVEAYVATTIRRAAAVRADLIVFGSGGSRRVPEGYARSAAWDQLVWFLGYCADHAEQHGLTIVIEPLNTNECNILNTYTESVESRCWPIRGTLLWMRSRWAISSRHQSGWRTSIWRIALAEATRVRVRIRSTDCLGFCARSATQGGCPSSVAGLATFVGIRRRRWPSWSLWRDNGRHNKGGWPEPTPFSVSRTG